MGSSRRRKSGAAHPDRQPDHEGNVSASDLVTGVAWYRREQWSRLRELASDRDKLDDSYEQWLTGAQKALPEMARTGVSARRVDVDVETLLRRCLDDPADGARTDGS